MDDYELSTFNNGRLFSFYAFYRNFSPDAIQQDLSLGKGFGCVISCGKCEAFFRNILQNNCRAISLPLFTLTTGQILNTF
jgi:hypothetical protein